MNARKQPIAGFSLLELAIVLVIISLTASALLTLGTKRTQAARMDLTNQRFDDIELDLARQAWNQGELPCPAVGWLRPDNPNYGQPDCANTLIAAQGIHVGTYPLRDEAMLDGWNRRITYVVDTDLTAANALLAADPDAPVEGSIIVRLTAGGTQLSNRAAIVLISHGANGHGAWPMRQAALNTDRISTTGSADENENAHTTGYVAGAPLSHDATFVQAAPSPAFDDAVRYYDRNRIIRLARGIVDIEYCRMIDRAILPANNGVVPPEGPIGCLAADNVTIQSPDCYNRQTNFATLLATACFVR